jgi:hypothetical protein
MPRSSMAPMHFIKLSSEFLRVFGSARVALFAFRSLLVSGVDSSRSRAAVAILRAAVGRRVTCHSSAARAGRARHISATLDAAACGAAVRPRSDLSHVIWPETFFPAFLKSIIIMLTPVEVPLSRLPMHSSTPQPPPDSTAIASQSSSGGPRSNSFSSSRRSRRRSSRVSAQWSPVDASCASSRRFPHSASKRPARQTAYLATTVRTVQCFFDTYLFFICFDYRVI